MAADIFASLSLYVGFPTIADSADPAPNDDSPDVKVPIVPILESVEDNSTLPTDQPIG